MWQIRPSLHQQSRLVTTQTGAAYGAREAHLARGSRQGQSERERKGQGLTQVSQAQKEA